MRAAMKKIILLIPLLTFCTQINAQPSIVVVPEDGKATLSGNGGGITNPTHVDVYRGTSNPPNDLFMTFIPTGYTYSWEDTNVENGTFYYYRVKVRDDALGSQSVFSNLSGGMPDPDSGSYYLFDGMEDGVQQLNKNYLEDTRLIEFDFKIDELTPGKNTEIFRFKLDQPRSGRMNILNVFHTEEELKVHIAAQRTGVSISWTLPTKNVADGEWHKIEISNLHSPTVIVHLDGIKYRLPLEDWNGNNNDVYSIIGQHDIFIGGRSNANTTHLKGGFDNLRILKGNNNSILIGQWRFDEHSMESTVFDSGSGKRHMTKVGNPLSATDVFDLNAMATNTVATSLTSSLGQVSPSIITFTLSSRPVFPLDIQPPGGVTSTILKNDLNLADYFPFEDRVGGSGTPIEYTIEYTVSRSDETDTTIVVSDITVPAVGFGTHYAFDGIDDVVRPAESIISDSNGTVEFLVKIAPEDRPSGFSYALVGKQNNMNRNGFVILHDGSRVWCQFRDGNGNNSNLYPQTAINLTDGNWHHVALTFEAGNSATLYVDGESAVTGNINDFNFTTVPLLIGKSSNTFWTPLKGGMDEIVIWNRILSPAEIQNRAFVKAQGDTQGLLAAYHFDENLIDSLAYDDGLYNHHATNSGATINQTTDNIPIQWVGLVDTEWDEPSNWNIGSLPDVGDDLLIASASNSPVISSGHVVDINDLTINTGSTLIVSAESTLEVNGDLSNDGTVTIESGASLITFDGNTITGNDITIKRNTRYADGRYSFVGTPVQQNATIVGSDLGSHIYKYNETTAYGVDGINRWEDASNDQLIPGVGYTQANQQEIAFAGRPNDGTITHTGTYTEDTNDANEGWILVANPYPTAINVQSFINGNPNIEGAVYIWDDNGSNTNRGTNADYIVANGTIATNTTPAGGQTRYNQHIGSVQGFFVKLKDNTDLDIDFTESMRVGDNSGDANFFRKSIPAHIRINLTNEVGLFKQAVVSWIDGISDTEVDRSFDAKVFNVSASDALYTIKANQALAIQGITSQKEEIPIGLNVAEAGVYRLAFDQEYLAGHSFLLRDNLTQETIDLNLGHYDFTVSAGQINNRFVLIQSSTILDLKDEQTSMYTYSTQGRLNIVFEASQLNEVTFQLIDLTGKLMKSKSLKTENNCWQINTQHLPNSIYILLIQTENNIWKTKVITK